LRLRFRHLANAFGDPTRGFVLHVDPQRLVEGVGPFLERIVAPKPARDAL
jgi:hypothetical protein